MNGEQAKALLPVITAFAEGKVIQNLSRVDGKWYDITSNDHVAFNLDPKQYRIKPEPAMLHVVVRGDGTVYQSNYKNLEEAINRADYMNKNTGIFSYGPYAGKTLVEQL